MNIKLGNRNSPEKEVRRETAQRPEESYMDENGEIFSQETLEIMHMKF